MKLTKEEQQEVVSLASATSAIIGYVSALEQGDLVMARYIKRLNEYYVPNLENAVKIFTDKL